MELLQRIALAAAVGLVALLPVAAAHDGCPDHPQLVDLYLKKDAQGNLGLSYLAPSAASATTWDVKVSSGAAAKQVTFDFPLPAFQVNEDIDLAGKIRLENHIDGSPSITSSLPPYNTFPRVRVELVEGERSVLLLYSYSAYGEFDLKGSYPGHGRDGAPHTHGNGTDASRGLHTSDLSIRMTFDVQGGWGAPGSEAFARRTYTVLVHVDGKTFLRVAKTADLPAEASPAPSPTSTPTSSSASSNNTSAADGTPTGDQPSAGQPAPVPPRVLSAMVERVGAPIGVAASMVVAVAGIAFLAWRRRTG